MKKSNNKNGFTLVELLVVIAILAILAVVSVVGYTSFTKKAQVSNDLSLTTQMNNILQVEEVSGEKNETAYDAIQQLEEGGIDVTKLTPTTNGYNYVYDIKQNRMFLLDENKTKIAPADKELSDTAYLFAFVGNNSDIASFAGYSYYLKSGFDFTSKATNSAIRINRAASTTKVLTISNGVGVDVGENKNVAITYTAPVSSDVIIRTTGDQSSITIKPQSTTTTSTIKVYGFAQTVAVDTSSSSNTTVAVAGSCNDLVVAQGNVDIEETAVIFKVVVPTSSTTETVKVSNKGYVAEVKQATITDGKVESGTEEEVVASSNIVSGNKTGGNYEISTLAQLESFRDTVNAGATFEGKTVELKKDITLKDGWTPIGEGTRTVNAASNTQSGNFFKGTFKGNGHTISNLNNKNYVPNQNRIISYKNTDNTKTEMIYAYGLFAIVDGATIENVKLTNVNIDGSLYSEVNMDSVGALVGYACGNTTISNITVSGSLYATDAVGGIVGRYYNILSSDTTFKVENCVNNANLKSNEKVAGIVGYVGKSKDTGTKAPKVTFTNCTNNGTITATITGENDNKTYLGDQLVMCQGDGNGDQARISWTGFNANGKIAVEDSITCDKQNVSATFANADDKTKGQNYSA